MEGQQLPLTAHSEPQSSSDGPWHPLYGSVTRHGSPWNITTQQTPGFLPLVLTLTEKVATRCSW